MTRGAPSESRPFHISNRHRVSIDFFCPLAKGPRPSTPPRQVIARGGGRVDFAWSVFNHGHAMAASRSRGDRTMVTHVAAGKCRNRVWGTERRCRDPHRLACRGDGLFQPGPASVALCGVVRSRVNSAAVKGVQIMRDKIGLDRIERSVKEIEQALLKIRQENYPTLYSDEFQLLVKEAVRRVMRICNLQDQFNQHRAQAERRRQLGFPE